MTAIDSQACTTTLCPLTSSVPSIIVRAVTPHHAEGLQYQALPTDDPLRALNILREAAGLQPLSIEHAGADFERREPRCRVCRDETVRVVANELLDWRGVPIFLGRSKFHRITLTDIMRDLTRSTRAVTRGTESPTSAYGITASVTTAETRI
jgi:hypothetical protein